MGWQLGNAVFASLSTAYAWPPAVVRLKDLERKSELPIMAGWKGIALFSEESAKERKQRPGGV